MATSAQLTARNAAAVLHRRARDDERRHARRRVERGIRVRPRAAMNVYSEVMVPRIFEPWGRALLDEVALEPGEAVLDVACGPGTVTRLAAARSGPAGRVTGCDLSPAMLEIAVGRGPIENGAAIDYVEAPADRLPVRDVSFDVAT